MSALQTFGILVIIAVVLARSKKSRLPLPPGPKPRPLIKNLFQFPVKEPAKVFTKWREQYGDLIYLHDMSGPTLVISSLKINRDLLDRRSAIYSDRPVTMMCDDLTGLSDWQFSLMHYSDSWRNHRRLFHQFFNENASKDYREIQEQCVQAFVHRLLGEPAKFLDHIRVLFANTILRIVYDIGVESHEDEYVEMAERTMIISTESLNPFIYPVNMFPFLRYLPSWFPGVKFHRAADDAKILSHDMRELPFEHAERNMNNSTGGPSVLRAMLDRLEENGGEGIDKTSFDLQLVKNCAAVAYLGGIDTTLSSIQMLFVVLANNPDVQKRAQAEIDAKIGKNRLPTFADIQDLPYIVAITKELLRWHNVVPFGLPHRVTEEDEYEGYRIPKGTRVFLNVWAVLHDPEIYPDPYTFNPSRWLIDTPNGPKINPAIPDPDIAVFGAGRRVCPGRHLAENSLLIITSNVLACFNISPLDNAGNPAEKVSERVTDGLLAFPEPFKVAIIPRSEQVVKIINETRI